MTCIGVFAIMYLELYFYIPVITTLVCALVLLLYPKKLLRAQRFLVACMFLVSFTFLLYAQFYNRYVVSYMGFDLLYSLIVSFCAPAYFYYTRLLTSPTGFKKYDWIALWPSAVELILCATCYIVLYANDEIEIYENYISHIGAMPDPLPASFNWITFWGSDFFVVFMAIQVIIFVMVSHHMIFRYSRKLKDFYATPDERFRHVFNVTICSAFIILISLVVVLVPVKYLATFWFVFPVCIVASVIQVILTYYAVKINSSAEDMNTDADEPEQSTMPELSSEYAEQLIKLFQGDKLYLDPDLTLVSLAKKLGTNRTYASRLIQETQHMSFSEYINQCRIEYAKEVMLNSDEDLKMSELSMMCGYASEQSFYRNFKNFTSQTPTTWLAENMK